jgi:ABC-type lipoprotein release transport system permease subunit
MTAAWLWARSRLRRRWPTLLVIALVAGLGAGVTLTAATGSHRAATGWQRFRTATTSPNLFFTPPPDADAALLRRVARLPGVTALGAFTYAAVSPATVEPNDEFGSFLGLDDGFLNTVYRPRILSGRRPDPRRADEISISTSMAKASGIEAGDRVQLRAGWATVGKFSTLGKVTVTGIHVGQFDVGANGGSPNMLLGNAFYRAHERQLVEALGNQPSVLVRLASGDAGVKDFERRMSPIYGGRAVVVSAKQDEAVVLDAVNVQKIGLAILAIAAGLATLVAAVQAVGRAFGTERADMAVLRSLGMRRRDLAVAGAGLGAAAGAVGAGVAVVTAVLASRLAPSGTAGKIEPPGLRVEPALLMSGALVIVMTLACAGALLAVRVATRPPRAGRAQPAVATGPLPVRLGLHWTFARTTPGAATGSARAALVAVLVGVGGIAAVVTFAASLDRLVDTPRLYGWDFDGGFQSMELDQAGLEDATKGLASDPRVDGLVWGTIVDVPVGSSTVELFALDQARGLLHPSVIEGRAPVGSDEIALGTETMSKAGLQVGSRVPVGEGRVPFHVVGRAVYPELGNSVDLANGGSITIDGLGRLHAEPVGTFALIRVRRGTSVQAVLDAHAAEGVDSGTPILPPRVSNIQSVGLLPWLMAGFLGLLALTAVGHALVLSVRARRHDLAVLRAIGAVRIQLASAVWSQATFTVLAGSVVGLPIGIAVGRQAWGLVVDGLGVVDSPVVAMGMLALLLAGLLGVVNLLATGPALIASRLRPAAVLRSE